MMQPKQAIRPTAILREDVRANILRRIDGFKRLTSLTDSQVGQRALKDTKFIARLRSGENFNMGTIDKLNTWLEDNKAVRNSKAVA
jgi:hypothetical protein